MIVDGKALAAGVLARARARAEVLGRVPRVVAIVANETPATRSYLAIKQKRAAEAGCALEVWKFSEDTSTAALRAAVLDAARDADAVIVQLPLPAGIDAKEVCDAIPLGKDADVLSSAARAQFEMFDLRNRTLLPPVVGAVREIFEQNGVDPRAKRAVVLGAGFLVGAPVATWLAQQGADVTVLTIENNSEERTAALRAADIIISGTGSPHLITPDALKQGVVLIDAGTSNSPSTSSGRPAALVGDADPACAEICSLFTPVPGGVGPLAVAMLFENAVSLAERATHA